MVAVSILTSCVEYSSTFLGLQFTFFEYMGDTECLPAIPWSQIMLINTGLAWVDPVTDCLEIREVSDGGRSS